MKAALVWEVLPQSELHQLPADTPEEAVAFAVVAEPRPDWHAAPRRRTLPLHATHPAIGNVVLLLGFGSRCRGFRTKLN